MSHQALVPPSVPPKPPAPGYNAAPASPAFPASLEHASGTDNGEFWLPAILQFLPGREALRILEQPSLLQALSRASATSHPAVLASRQALLGALAANIELSLALQQLAAQVSAKQTGTQALLLSTHALERLWLQKQADVDLALEAFSPASLYQRLVLAVQEQAAVCSALEHEFLQDDGQTVHSEREIGDWIARYRAARALQFQRQERRERWDQGRVGGWRGK